MSLCERRHVLVVRALLSDAPGDAYCNGLRQCRQAFTPRVSSRAAKAVDLVEPAGDLVPTGRHWGRQPPLTFQAEAAPPKRVARRWAVTDPSELRLSSLWLIRTIVGGHLLIVGGQLLKL